MDHNLDLKFKIWMEKDGKAFGEGPCALLEGVERTGSLRQAAQEMDMSYSLAHKLIKNLEKRLGYPLITRTIGGAGGGGSSITPQARDLIDNYQAFLEEASQTLQDMFIQYFRKDH